MRMDMEMTSALMLGCLVVVVERVPARSDSPITGQDESASLSSRPSRPTRTPFTRRGHSRVRYLVSSEASRAPSELVSIS